MRILIVLVPGFSHLSLGAILEPLHRLKAVKPKARLRIEVGSVTAVSYTHLRAHET